MAKVCYIGAGNVGSQAAHAAALAGVEEICLVDVDGDMARGKALDIQQAAALCGRTADVRGGDSYALVAAADLVVISAGLARRPGMTREDLMTRNAEIVSDVCRRALAQAPDTIFIVVSNPVNLMAQRVYDLLGLPRERVIGMAGVLDNARFRARIMTLGGYAAHEIETLVAGDHGDLMVPLVSQSRVAGHPLEQCLSPQQIREAVEATRNGGTEIVNLLKKGSAWFAPGLSIQEIVAAILGPGAETRATRLCCSTFLHGEYGIEGLYLGVPVEIGRSGMEAVVELDLPPAEREALQQAAAYLRPRVARLRESMPVGG